jgi:hypothetical protein
MSTLWGNKTYMNMKHLESALYDASISRAEFNQAGSLLTNLAHNS